MNKKLHDDAMSLHSQLAAGPSSGSGSRQFPVELEDDVPQLHIDDLPPLYSEIDGDGGPVSESSAPLLPQGSQDDEDLNLDVIEHAIRTYKKDQDETSIEAVVPLLAGDGPVLEKFVKKWAKTPPRMFMQLKGTHCKTVERNNRKETERVTDFDVRVDLTPFLFTDAQRAHGWYGIYEPALDQKVRRGTVFRCRAGDEYRMADLESGRAVARSGLDGWCQRFCEDPSPLKCFQLRQYVKGFDFHHMRSKLEALVRRTNYHGSLSVSFPTYNAKLLLYNDNRINRWRLMLWLRILFSLTLLFLFTWPYLFFRTKRYEVITVGWDFSREENGVKNYASLSEDHIYNMWARAINKAILARQQGELNQDDLRDAEGAELNFRTGNEAVDGAVDVLQAGINAMGHVNRQFGWGGDC